MPTILQEQSNLNLNNGDQVVVDIAVGGLVPLTSYVLKPLLLNTDSNTTNPGSFSSYDFTTDMIGSHRFTNSAVPPVSPASSVGNAEAAIILTTNSAVVNGNYKVIAGVFSTISGTSSGTSLSTIIDGMTGLSTALNFVMGTFPVVSCTQTADEIMFGSNVYPAISGSGQTVNFNPNFNYTFSVSSLSAGATVNGSFQLIYTNNTTGAKTTLSTNTGATSYSAALNGSGVAVVSLNNWSHVFTASPALPAVGDTLSLKASFSSIALASASQLQIDTAVIVPVLNTLLNNISGLTPNYNYVVSAAWAVDGSGVLLPITGLPISFTTDSTGLGYISGGVLDTENLVASGVSSFGFTSSTTYKLLISLTDANTFEITPVMDGSNIFGNILSSDTFTTL